MKEAITFDDVLIQPKFSDIKSRKDVDISSNQPGLPYIKLPVISANMDTVTCDVMAKAMLSNGAQACLHRFCSIEDNIKMFNKSLYGDQESLSSPMVSIGLGTKELDRADALKFSGAGVFIIDVAHGANVEVVKQANELRKIIGDYRSIIVGNFATAESVKTFLEHFPDVDGFKIGVGPGSGCTTRIQTGVGYPQLSAIIEISKLLKNTRITVIADGGMKTPGDIAKALAAGAHMVMVGGMLAGTEESPGKLIGPGTHADDLPKGIKLNFNHEDKYWKYYRGSASKESYETQGKNDPWRTHEGESFLVPHKGPVKDILQNIEGGLRSSFSYVGAKNLKEFHEKAEFVKVSNSTVVENSAHGKNRS